MWRFVGVEGGVVSAARAGAVKLRKSAVEIINERVKKLIVKGITV